MPTATKKEEAFAELVRGYENQWVAIIEKNGKEEVVGAGQTPKEALNQAHENGFTEVVLFSVPSFSHSLAY